MTPEQIALVQGSFRQVTPMAARIADLFYGRLFERAPEVRPLFSDDLAEQKKKLMQMLGLAVTGLNSPETLLPAVVGLGERHSGYEVAPEHYAVVGEALIWALRQGLGDEFTQDVAEAWTAAYGTLADVMIGASSGGS
ncbi:globin family protein [Shimia sp.]|jgi:nitric oxide dioxygenase|uniref:globin family protein n=1 Tax=unclassified Shimia TaxID=2630038 RepID=UPI0025D6D700|nr:globin family protein [Shimia sp.]MCH2069309.1 globin domain-containing protein [Shimia sp.]